MGEFFRGWKRKVGVVTLILACAFAGLWVRSLYYQDQIRLPEFDREREGYMASLDGSFRWSRNGRMAPNNPMLGNSVTPLWTSRPINKNLWSSIVPNDGPGVVGFRPLGFSFGTFGAGNDPITFCCCSYSILVLPLTLLSAWLLLSKPRPAKQAAPPITTAN